MRRRLLQLQIAILRHLTLPGLALIVAMAGAMAQSGDQHAGDQSGKPASANSTPTAEATKDNQRKIDEFTEAAQAINGPAGNPECVWLGRRVVILMSHDDLDTAFRHLDLYDRFGCPGGHIQATFRCVARFGLIGPVDPKTAAELPARVHSCWINPAAQPQPVASAQPAAAPAGGSAPAAAPAAAASAAAPAK